MAKIRKLGKLKENLIKLVQKELNQERKRKHKLAWRKHIDEDVLALAMQRRPTLKLGVSFCTYLYTDINIHSSWEVCFAQRNALQVAIVCFEYTVFTVRKEKLVRSSPLKIILFEFIAKREYCSSVMLFYYAWASRSEDLVFSTNMQGCPISSNKLVRQSQIVQSAIYGWCSSHICPLPYRSLPW